MTEEDVEDEIFEFQEIATSVLQRRGDAFLIGGVGVRSAWAYPVSASMGAHLAVSGTKASVGTTNAISAAYSAHIALQYLAGLDLPFVMRHVS